MSDEEGEPEDSNLSPELSGIRQAAEWFLRAQAERSANRRRSVLPNLPLGYDKELWEIAVLRVREEKILEDITERNIVNIKDWFINLSVKLFETYPNWQIPTEIFEIMVMMRKEDFRNFVEDEKNYDSLAVAALMEMRKLVLLLLYAKKKVPLIDSAYFDDHQPKSEESDINEDEDLDLD